MRVLLTGVAKGDGRLGNWATRQRQWAAQLVMLFLLQTLR